MEGPRGEGIETGDRVATDTTATSPSEPPVRLDLVELTPDTVVDENLEGKATFDLVRKGGIGLLGVGDGLPCEVFVISDPGSEAAHLDIEAAKFFFGVSETEVLVNEGPESRISPWAVTDISAGFSEEVEFGHEGFGEDVSCSESGTRRGEGTGSGVVLVDGGADGLDTTFQVLCDLSSHLVTWAKKLASHEMT